MLDIGIISVYNPYQIADSFLIGKNHESSIYPSIGLPHM